MKPYFERNGITLYHGDCEAVLPTLDAASVELVFTSPPYNMGLSSGGGKNSVNPAITSPAGKGARFRDGYAATTKTVPGYAPSKSGKGRRWIDGYADRGDDCVPWEDYEAQQAAVLRLCARLLTASGAIFYNHKPRVLHKTLWTPFRCVPPELNVRQVVIWDRMGGGINMGDGHYLSQHEWIVILAGRDFVLRSRADSALGDVWRIPYETRVEHPAPFPVGLPGRAINSTGARSVLDPYVGSGSTLVAAQAAGIRAVGIEKNEAYCELAANRLSQLALPLFA